MATLQSLILSPLMPKLSLHLGVFLECDTQPSGDDGVAAGDMKVVPWCPPG